MLLEAAGGLRLAQFPGMEAAPPVLRPPETSIIVFYVQEEFLVWQLFAFCLALRKMMAMGC
jgi:hypothetical protein